MLIIWDSYQKIQVFFLLTLILQYQKFAVLCLLDMVSISSYMSGLRIITMGKSEEERSVILLVGYMCMQKGKCFLRDVFSISLSCYHHHVLPHLQNELMKNEN
jgi:hypothetical protein